MVCSFLIYFIYFYVGHWGSCLKNSHSLTVSIQLAAFNFIPAKFQSRSSLRPLTFGACTKILPHLPFPFSGLLEHLCCYFQPWWTGASVCILEILQRKAKRQQFSAWISLWLNPLIILGVPEREGVRWRGMFYPLITPTFTPSCLSVVVLLLVALLLYSLESCWDWSYFMLRLPGPQFKNSGVSLFTHSCHTARGTAEFCLLPPFCEGILCGILKLVTNRSNKDDYFMSVLTFYKFHMGVSVSHYVLFLCVFQLEKVMANTPKRCIQHLMNQSFLKIGVDDCCAPWRVERCAELHSVLSHDRTKFCHLFLFDLLGYAT